MAQLHKKFTDDQVSELIEKYLRKEVGRKYLQEILGINKTRFFALVRAYCDNPYQFSIRYIRKGKTRAIPEAVETNILKELTIEKKLIEDENVPVRITDGGTSSWKAAGRGWLMAEETTTYTGLR